MGVCGTNSDAVKYGFGTVRISAPWLVIKRTPLIGVRGKNTLGITSKYDKITSNLEKFFF